MDWKRMIIGLVVVSIVLGGTHYFLIARLVRDTALPPRAATIGRWLIALLGVLTVAGFGLARSTGSLARVLTNVSYVWLGLFFFLFLGLLATDLARLLGWVGAKLASAPPADPERRVWLARVAALAAGGAAVGTSVYGASQALGEIRVQRVPVAVRHLSRPFRVVQISDVHIGATLRRDWLARIVAHINQLEADVVVITGDLVDGSVQELAEHVAPLADLRAKEGVFFVTGNHEYYSGALEWCAHLPTLGVRVLRNERVALSALDLAGVDDWSAADFGHGHGADYDKALGGRSPDRAVVLLAHQPRAIVHAKNHAVDLLLSGHTHGGQLFPWNLMVPLQQPFVAGLHQVGDTQIYVSRGTGFWGPPMRVGAPAEITQLDLAPA